MSSESVLVSGRLKKSENIDYIERLADKEGSKSEALRRAVTIARLESSEQLSRKDVNDSSSTVGTSETDSRSLLKTRVMRVLVNGDEKDMDLNDKNSEAYDPSVNVAVDPRELGTDWDEFDPVGGRFSTGRKHPLRWVVHWLNKKGRGSKGIREKKILEVFQNELGLARSSANNYLTKLVAEGSLYPDPSTKNGVLTDSFIDEVRINLDGGTGECSPSLSKDTKDKYPDDWSDLLSNYDRFVNKVYYTDRSAYLSRLIESVKVAVYVTSRVRTSASEDPETRMDGEDRALVWRQVAGRLNDKMLEEVPIWDSKVENKESPYHRAEVLRVEGKQVDPKAFGESEEKVEWNNQYREFVEFVSSRVGKYTQSSEGAPDNQLVSVTRALGEFNWTHKDLNSVTPQDVESRFREITKEEHPDSSEVEFARDFGDLVKCKQVLIEEVRDSNQ